MKHFPKSIHALCCKHKTDNLIDNCKYKRNSPKMNEIVDIVMGLMAGCADKLEFHRLKATVDTNGFTGTYFEDLANLPAAVNHLDLILMHKMKYKFI